MGVMYVLYTMSVASSTSSCLGFLAFSKGVRQVVLFLDSHNLSLLYMYLTGLALSGMIAPRS